MPWDATSFGHHDHSMGIAHAAHAASVANAIVRRTGNEGLAISTAIAREKEHGHAQGGGIAGPFWLSQHGGIDGGHFRVHLSDPRVPRRDSGGVVDPTSSGIGGVAPSAQTMSPLMQGMIQRYASLPVEKLQELSGMLGSSPQGQVVQRLLAQKLAMPNAQGAQQPQQRPTATQQQQMPASPLPQQQQAQHRGGTVRRDAGGGMGISMGMASPWWERQEAEANARPGSGFLAGNTMGRQDAVHTQAPGGSYILPADVVSGLGEGNSLAGARVWDEILNSGPHGTPMPHGSRGRGPPPPPREPGSTTQSFGNIAKGGGVQGKDAPGASVPVALSHGEIVVMPQDVMWIGGGNLRKGHRVLDAWVQSERKKQIKKLASLPGPVGAKKAT